MTWDKCRRAILDELAEQGDTISGFASRLKGVKKTTVYEALNGQTDPRAATLFAFLDALGKDLGWLHRATRAKAAA